MKTLKQLLLEIPIGKELFADTQDNNISYDAQERLNSLLQKHGINYEPNTESESELIDIISSYVNGGRERIDGNSLRSLFKLKYKYPHILSPDDSVGPLIFRGMTVPIDILAEAFDGINLKDGNNENFIKSNVSNKIVTSNNSNGFLSFSTILDVANKFSKRNNFTSLRIPVTCAVRSDKVKNKLLFNPDFLETLGDMQEFEVMYFDKSFPVYQFYLRSEYRNSLISGINNIKK